MIANLGAESGGRFSPGHGSSSARWRREIRGFCRTGLLMATQQYCRVVMMIPEFSRAGGLPAGIHWATLQEIESRFGFSHRRTRLLAGLKSALAALHAAGCRRVYLDGRFV